MKVPPKVQARYLRKEAADLRQQAHRSSFDDRRLAWLESEAKRMEEIVAKDRDSMSIGAGKVPKVALRLAVGLFHGTVRKAEDMRADLEASPHAHIRDLHRILLDVAGKVRNRWQSLRILEVGEFLLWVADKDTAYQDQFAALLAQVQGMPKVEAKPPEAWFVNLVVDEPGWTRE